MKRYILVIMILLPFLVEGQNVERPIVKNGDLYRSSIPTGTNPNVYSFMNVNYIPVSNYTGRAKVEIPIYTIEDGAITVPISLSYNTGGIKVNTVASNVGLNWSLNAGGSIAKVVQGVEDCYYKYSKDKGTVLSAGWLMKKNINDKIESEVPLSFDTAREDVEIDTRPDLFIGSAPGLDIKFSHDLDGNAIELNGQSNIIKTTLGKTREVEFYDFKSTPFSVDFEGGGVRELKGVISQVEVRSVTGLMYSFNDLEIAQSVVYQDEQTNYSCYRVTKEQVTSYMLSKITDELNEREVKFSYENYRLEGDQVQTGIYRAENGLKAGEVLESLAETKMPQLKRVSSINFSSGRVEFTYGKEREDNLGDKALTEIKVFNLKNEIVKMFEFTYDYYITGNGQDPSQKRLRLNSIREISPGALSYQTKKKPPYLFSYEQTELPKRCKLGNQDFLGYVRSNSDEMDKDDVYSLYYSPRKGRFSILPFAYKGFTSIITNKGKSLLPNPKFTQAGLLNRIQYPTGALQEIEYESNTFLLGDREVTGGGVRVKKIRKFDPKADKKQTQIYDYKSTDGKTSGRIGYVPRFADVDLMTNIDYDTETSNHFKHLKFTLFHSDLNLAEFTHGAYVGYGQVTVCDSIDNGKIEYHYTTFDDYPNEHAKVEINNHVYNWHIFNYKLERNLLPTIFNNRDNCRGNLLRKVVYDNQGDWVTKEVWKYESNTLREFDVTHDLHYYDFLLYHKNKFECSSCYITNSLKLRSERFNKTSYKIEENRNNRIISKEEMVSYDTEYPLIKTQSTFNSLVQKHTKKYFYPHEIEGIATYSSAEKDVIKNLVNGGYCNFSQPIKIESYVGGKLLQTVQHFYENKHGKIRLSKTKSKNGADSFREVAKYKEFDHKGNIFQYEKLGQTTSYHWGYNATLPIAIVQNAASNEFAHTSFEDVKYSYEQGSQKKYSDDWLINEGGHIYDYGKTGSRSLGCKERVSGPEIINMCSLTSIEEMPVGDYWLSVWVKNKPNKDNGSLKSWSIPNHIESTSEWTHHKIPVTISSAQKITLNLENDILVDAVRFYPRNALMTTFTHRPLVGMESKTDTNGKTTHYEYDGFGRLIRVRDHEKSVIKEHVYSY